MTTPARRSLLAVDCLACNRERGSEQCALCQQLEEAEQTARDTEGENDA